jgi:acetyl esterase/lipase
MRTLATLLSAFSAIFGALHFARLPSGWGMRLLLVRILPGALAPIWAIYGALGALLGLRQRRPLVVLGGVLGAAASLRYIFRTRRAAAAYRAPVFDALATPVELRRDIVFRIASVPDTVEPCDRPVYADLWLPGPGIPRSGVGVIYLHGSAWYLGNKGQLTGPVFRAWAADGHMVMDVAYRMCPETDVRGMMEDAQHAVAWLKTHAAEFGVDPQRIVLSGTSAGGHIALITAYTADHADLLAPDLAGQDVSVAGVFTVSAPVDMRAMLVHHPGLLRSANPPLGVAYDPLTDTDPLVPPGPGASRRESLRWERAQNRRLNGLLRDLLGGGPDDAPEMYALASAPTHVRPGLPPTLLIQGDQDALVPVGAARDLARQLQSAGVPITYLELPQTDHGFEIALPHLSPPALAAVAAIKRFLRTI